MRLKIIERSIFARINLTSYFVIFYIATKVRELDQNKLNLRCLQINEKNLPKTTLQKCRCTIKFSQGLARKRMVRVFRFELRVELWLCHWAMEWFMQEITQLEAWDWIQNLHKYAEKSQHWNYLLELLRFWNKIWELTG